jgi:hypothetical protein
MGRCIVAFERLDSMSHARAVTKGGHRGTSSSTIVSLKHCASSFLSEKLPVIA